VSCDALRRALAADCFEAESLVTLGEIVRGAEARGRAAGDHGMVETVFAVDCGTPGKLHIERKATLV
jgi:hypothetical protein